MAERSSSKAGPSLTVMATILERLNGLTPEQFTAPPKPVEADATVVGVATDHMRRLYTLKTEVALEHNALHRVLDSLGREISRATSRGRGPIEILRNLVTGGLSAEKLDRYQQVKREHELKIHLYEVVNTLLVLEIKTNFDGLDDKPILAIYDDWSIGWKEEEDESPLDLLFGDSNMPDEIREMLGRAMGGHHNSRRHRERTEH